MMPSPRQIPKTSLRHDMPKYRLNPKEQDDHAALHKCYASVKSLDPSKKLPVSALT